MTRQQVCSLDRHQLINCSWLVASSTWVKAWVHLVTCTLLEACKVMGRVCMSQPAVVKAELSFLCRQTCCVQVTVRKAGLAAASRLLQELPELECVAELWVRAALPMVSPVSLTRFCELHCWSAATHTWSCDFVTASRLQPEQSPGWFQHSCVMTPLCMALASLCVLASWSL